MFNLVIETKVVVIVIIAAINYRNYENYYFAIAMSSVIEMINKLNLTITYSNNNYSIYLVNYLK